MAAILKTKLTVSSVSILVIVLIPLLQSNFNAEATIKEYGQLTWDDFQGIPRPFTGFDAGINSGIYLMWDSAMRNYRAFAGQNNMRSWAKEEMRKSETGLRHEQYHFNITEVHARKMNEYILQNPDKDASVYYERRHALSLELRKMQSRYDNESDHSLIASQQNKWEYKIDSLLMVSTGDPGRFTDYYSGVSGFFTASPKFDEGISSDGVPARTVIMEKYQMMLGINSFQLGTDQELLEVSIRSYYESNKMTIISLNLDTAGMPKRYKAQVKDSLGNNMVQVWISGAPNFYRATAIFAGTGEVSGYHEIASSFLNSIKIENQDAYWVGHLNPENPSASTTTPFDTPKQDHSCLNYWPVSDLGFYWGPVWTDNGSMMVVMDLIPKEDIKPTALAMSVGKSVYRIPLDGGRAVYYLPAESIPKESFHFMFGFTVKQSPTDPCEEFRHQVLFVERP